MATASPFQGTRVAEWTSDLCALSETTYRPRHRTATHVHRGATLAFVLSGAFVERQGSRTLECAPGAVLLRPAGSEHDDAFADDEARCFNVELPADFVAPGAVTVVDSRVGAPAWAAAGILAHVRQCGRDEALTLEARVAELVDALGSPSSAVSSAQVGRASRELRERFAEPWSLSSLARSAGVHPVHFARVFRRTHGESVGGYVHRLRVEYAARQLARTSLSIAEIAAAAGFADQAHLSRVFRRRTGETPARFRATLRLGRTLRSFKTR